MKVLAQAGTITGKVTIKSTGEPLSHASVFLSNATFGTSTAADGTFALYNVKPGQYELVVTSLGYEDYLQTIVVGKNPITIKAEVVPKVTQLREVMITSGGSWKRNYEQFLKDFIGDTPDGKLCKIINPKDLNLLNHKTKKYLEGYSYDFLDIDNYAIGYKLRILLKEFKSDNLNHIISWTGKVLYQELPGTAAQKAKWAARREEIYYGSAMQFYRSLIHNTMDKDGFVIRILQRKPNLQRPSEELIQQKLDKFKAAGNRDSVMFWAKLEELPKYDEHLIRQPLKVDNVLHPTQMPGIYAMAFPGCLYVVYTKKKETFDFKDLYRPLDMENFETSIITLYNDYVLFDDNGVVVSPGNTLYEGNWSLSKVAQLLPVDYLPEGVKN
ncbi:carboxypeptidase-like regulatory domain-containing protein [Mucilaginibacter ginkgonis]|uniref:Carboxypeptidase-like regulatory domain-containing protein n=1 Tax=Mucilaginibacter ginkgonis TaxID=2682091 RepID=A0A7T7JFF3_9SPHI|nr:carboxypeptidase-like regulatory domain-containing protein [Mucilaginibacter ginkgonis]QQL48402.1 carboxypeptidase-like regulatory domain-containing protein [Mucilaginibacter ginkgonis]